LDGRKGDWNLLGEGKIRLKSCGRREKRLRDDDEVISG
jgi:hypothetical protein